MNKTQLLVSTAMVLAGSATGYAQESEDQDKESRLEKVTVSATFTEKKELETVTSVSIVGGEQIERQQANSVTELIQEIPGVAVNGGQNRQGNEFILRGISKPEQNIVRVDGVTKFFESYRMGSFFGDPELLKQIDVVRGPVSTLYGSGAIGGVVSMTTKDAADFLKPGQTFGAKVKAGFNTANDEWNGSTFLYARPQENIDLLGAVTFRDSDDYKFAGGGTFDGSSVNARNVLLKGTVVLADYHTLSASYQYGSDSGVVEYRQNDRGTENEGLVDRELEDTSITAKYAYEDEENPWVDLEINFGYSKTHNLETGLDQAGFNAPVAQSLAAGETRVADYKSWQISAINTSKFEGGNIKQLITYGLDYYSQERFGQQNGRPSSHHASGQQNVFGAFIQDEINIYDRVILTPAIRYASYTTEGDATGFEDRINDPADFLTADMFADAKRYTAWTPSVTAELKLVDQFSLIGGYFEGFRAPAIDEIYAHSLFFGAPFPPGVADKTTSLQLQEEKAKTWQGGFKGSFEGVAKEGDVLRFKLVYFENDISDKIVSVRAVPATVNPVSYLNDGDDKYKGWEFEGFYDNGVTYARTSYSRIRGRNITRGTDLTSTPSDQFTFSVGTRVDALELDLGWQAAFLQGRSVTDRMGNVTNNPAYNVHNLYVKWTPKAFDGFEVQLAANNVFDKDYQRHNSGIRSFARDVRLTASYQF